MFALKFRAGLIAPLVLFTQSTSPAGILLVGPPGCGKSEFLKQIAKAFPNESLFIDGSYGSKAGIFEALKERRPKYVLLDEPRANRKREGVNCPCLFCLYEYRRIIRALLVECDLQKTGFSNHVTTSACCADLNSTVLSLSNFCRLLCGHRYNKFPLRVSYDSEYQTS